MLGGAHSYGTVFSVMNDGTGYSLLHSFGIFPDGKEPHCGLVSDGSRLYGLTKYGGYGGFGALVGMNKDGAMESTIWSFGAPPDGKYPQGRPLLHDGRIYGTATTGGLFDYGTVFSIKTDGTAPSILHDFGSQADDGKEPLTGVIIQGGRLYGTTLDGGEHGHGTVFAVGTDGLQYSILHSFDGADGGMGPYGTLVSDGSKLYGVTIYGGSAHYGTVFSVGSDGLDFTVLHAFAGPPNDGVGPAGGLALDGTTLYGTTILGGQHSPIGGGTLFSLNTDGSNFSILHSFAGDGVSPPDGCQPGGDLLISDNKIYGTTTAPGEGTIFCLPLGALRVTLNSTTLAPGQRFTVDVLIQPISQRLDAWAVIMGSGGTYSMVYGNPGQVRTGARAYVRGVQGLTSQYSGRLLDITIPGNVAGSYNVIVGLVPAGVNPTGVQSAIPGYVDQKTVSVQ
jgi:uncharacterized repeat protein (TIGR03803 family)